MSSPTTSAGFYTQYARSLSLSKEQVNIKALCLTFNTPGGDEYLRITCIEQIAKYIRETGDLTPIDSLCTYQIQMLSILGYFAHVNLANVINTQKKIACKVDNDC